VRNVGLWLGIFLGIVLAIGVMPSDPNTRIGIAQLWLLSPLGLIAVFGFSFLFPRPIGTMCSFLRIAAPVAAVLALLHADWNRALALLVLALVFQAGTWIAAEALAGRGMSGTLHDARCLLQDLREKRAEREARASGPNRPAPSQYPSALDDSPAPPATTEAPKGTSPAADGAAPAEPARPEPIPAPRESAPSVQDPGTADDGRSGRD
jgi:hypothetical protein